MFKESYERKFLNLVEDSIKFLFLSEEALHEVRHDDMQLFSRCSAFFSMLILESAANSLIDTLSLEKEVFKKIDRLPILEKYDFFLKEKNLNGLARGYPIVQKIAEVIKLRDAIVHPKKSKFVWQKFDEETGYMEGTYEKTDMLKIADNYLAWETKDAVKIAGAVHSFLQDYFFNLCGMNSEQCCAILYSEKEVPSDTDEDFGIPALLIMEKEKLNSWNIPTDYINCK